MDMHWYQKISTLSLDNIIIIIIIALDNAPYKMLHKLKSACFIRKTNSEQARLQVFKQKSLDYPSGPSTQQAIIPTAGTSNSKGSQTPIRPVAGTTRSPRTADLKATDQRLPNPWCKKQQGKPERDL